MVKRIDVQGILGTPIRVLFVPKDDPRPNHLNNVDHSDLIEFYDLRYDHTPDGQFITAYNLTSILTASPGGLDLLTYEKSWKINPQTYRVIVDWIIYYMEGAGIE